MSMHTDTEAIVQLAQEYGDAISESRQQEADFACERLEEILRAMDPAAKTTVLPKLCEHPSCSVRLWAATYLSAIDPDLAERILVACTRDNSLLGLVAEMNLDRHRSGQLQTKK